MIGDVFGHPFYEHMAYDIIAVRSFSVELPIVCFTRLWSSFFCIVARAQSSTLAIKVLLAAH